MNIASTFAGAPAMPRQRETNNEITLTGYEIFMAAMVGVRRQIEALQNGLADRAGFKGLGWDVHIEGAAGELAFARFRNLYWSGSIGTFKRGGDVGPIQVRTRSKSHYDLIVRNSDRDDDAFVLVTGIIPSFRIIGWVYGRDAKLPQYRKAYGGRPAAFFVPQSELQPFEARS